MLSPILLSDNATWTYVKLVGIDDMAELSLEYQISWLWRRQLQHNAKKTFLHILQATYSK